jgi:translation initiation factor eIF-2B subunit alpha
VLSKQFTDKLVREYQACARDNPKMAVATVAIKTLTTLIIQSQATTMMGLEKEIKEAAAALQRCAMPDIVHSCAFLLPYVFHVNSPDSNQ